MQIPAYALYALTINVLLPWWNTPKLDDMPETGGWVVWGSARMASSLKQHCSKPVAALPPAAALRCHLMLGRKGMQMGQDKHRTSLLTRSGYPASPVLAIACCLRLGCRVV